MVQQKTVGFLILQLRFQEQKLQQSGVRQFRTKNCLTIINIMRHYKRPESMANSGLLASHGQFSFFCLCNICSVRKRKPDSQTANPVYLAFPSGFEPLACRLGGDRSILLSYGNMWASNLTPCIIFQFLHFLFYRLFSFCLIFRFSLLCILRPL